LTVVIHYLLPSFEQFHNSLLKELPADLPVWRKNAIYRQKSYGIINQLSNIYIK